MQAIALGKEFVVLALGGDSQFRNANLMISPFSNDDTTPPDDPRISAAIRQVLARVGR